MRTPATHTVPITFRSALMPLATVLIWSVNTVVTKASSSVISPSSISFYRWLLAFVVLLPFVGRAAWRERAVAMAHWKQLAALGAMGMVIYQCLAYEAAYSTTAVNMGVIVALMPLFSTLLASILASERLTFARVAGAIVSLAGLVYLTSHGDPAGLLHGELHVGDALMLVAVVSNSLYGVMLKRWAIPLSVIQQLLWQIGFSTLMLLPVWLLGAISPITSANLPLILFAAIPTSLLAPLCWMIGVRQLGAARSALFLNLLPVIVALLAWLWLGEHLQVFHLIGGALALFGVSLGLGEWRWMRVRRSASS
ncbi:MAG TPA: DMT family transporter [Bordetella sp.]